MMERFLYAVGSGASILCAVGLCGSQEVKKQRAKIEEQKAQEEIRMSKRAKKRVSMERRREHMRRPPSPDTDSPRPRPTAGRSRADTVSHLPPIYRDEHGFFTTKATPDSGAAASQNTTTPGRSVGDNQLTHSTLERHFQADAHHGTTGRHIPLPTHAQSFTPASPINKPGPSYSKPTNQAKDGPAHSPRHGDSVHTVRPLVFDNHGSEKEYGPHGVPKGGFTPQPSKDWSEFAWHLWLTAVADILTDKSYPTDGPKLVQEGNAGSPHAQPDLEKQVRFRKGQQL